MTTVRAKSRGIIVGAFMISGLILEVPARGRWQGSGTPEVEAAIPGSQSASASGVSPRGSKTLRQRVKSMVERLTPERIKRNREFKMASATFPDFCKHWEQNLRDREVNNLHKLNFSKKAGFETAT